MSFLFGTSNKTYLKEVLDREIVYGEDECIFILDIAFYGVIGNVNYLPTRLNFLVNDRQYNDFKVNHRYPNDSYLTITKTYGKYVSRLGYPVVLKVAEAKEPIKVTLQMYTTRNDEEFLELQVNLFLQMNCDMKHRIGDMTIKYFYDPDILKINAFSNLPPSYYPDGYHFVSVKYLEELEQDEEKRSSLYGFDTPLITKNKDGQTIVLDFSVDIEQLEKTQIWTTYPDPDSYIQNEKRSCVHEMTHREIDVETRTITYYDLIEVPHYNRETLEEQLLYHSEDIHEDCNESSDE